MTRIVTIQPATLEDLTRPYPYHILPDGSVDRQDFWQGTHKNLMGFQRTKTQRIDVSTREFLENPKQVVGMYPVFTDADGQMFALENEISDVYESDTNTEPTA